MTEVVGAKLQLESIESHLPPRWRHHGGVVDQQVEAVRGRSQLVAERLDGIEAGQIQPPKTDLRASDTLANLIDGGSAFRAAAPRNNDSRFGAGQRQRALKT
jgi:hypothetical protein